MGGAGSKKTQVGRRIGDSGDQGIMGVVGGVKQERVAGRVGAGKAVLGSGKKIKTAAAHMPVLYCTIQNLAS